MDCIRGKENSEMYTKIKEAIPIKIQTIIPQVTLKLGSFSLVYVSTFVGCSQDTKDNIWLQITEIPVVFISALEGRGRIEVMKEVIDTYKRWCSRLSTGRLNRWLRKVCTMSELNCII